MKTLIYSFLGLRHDERGPPPELVAAYELWLSHLRGPGHYRGDIMLVTDHRELQRPGVRIVPPAHTGADTQEAFFARVFNHSRIPAADYDVVLHSDLDVLAVNQVQPLFDLKHPFYAATSGLRLYDPRHAGNWRNFPFTAWRGRLPGQRHRPGVSPSVFACRSEDWEPCMTAWARLIRRHRHQPLTFADQTILNLAFARQAFPIEPYPPAYIRHNNWAAHPDAILWHFPTTNRLEVMRQHAQR